MKGLLSKIALLLFCFNNSIAEKKSLIIVDNEPQEINKEESFKSYLKKIPLLPVNYQYDSEENLKNIPNIESKYKPAGSTIIGRLPSSGKLHFIIYRYTSDIFIPILEIYDDNGKKTGQHELIDISFVANEFEWNYGRFKILNDSVIKMENYKLNDSDTIIVEVQKINIKKINNYGL